jgi:urease accessory protein
MLRFTEIVVASADRRADGILTMRFEDRRRSRLRTRLDDGREIALILPRGTRVREGDRLRAEDGSTVIQVRAAAQTLSRVRTADHLLLARAAYHLGNRHVPVQVGPGWLAYEHDHVLDGMIADLGLHAETVSAPFEPEAGGYRHGEGRGHAHDHAPGHAHDDGHTHGDGQAHAEPQTHDDRHAHGESQSHDDGHDHDNAHAHGDHRHEH